MGMNSGSKTAEGESSALNHKIFVLLLHPPCAMSGKGNIGDAFVLAAVGMSIVRLLVILSRASFGAVVVGMYPACA